MDVIYSRVAALDVSKKDAKVCVRRPGPRAGTFTKEVTTWGSMTNQVLELREFLLAQQVSLVVMEATGDYWKPFYYLLEDALPVQLINAAHAKNLPGRKTDVNDAQWLAQLAAHGLLRGSLVPPPPVRELRDLTRTRAKLTNDRSKEKQRLEKLLEDAGVKLTTVASDLLGVSGRAMLTALCEGIDDPEAMAEMAKGRMRSKIPQLREALTGRFTAHHAFLTRLHLNVIDGFDDALAQLEKRIEVVIEPFRPAAELLMSMPGVAKTTAQALIAEAGAVIDCFPSAACFASWAGLAPGLNQSGPKAKPAHTRHGNTYLKGALGIAALSVSRSKGTFFAARYRRIASRRGPMKALVATEHSMAVAMWHMLTRHVPYLELGGDYYSRRDPERAKARIAAHAEALGLAVTFHSLPDNTAS